MKVSIEKQSDGTYIAYNQSGEHCILIGTGNTISEAKDDFFNSVKEVTKSYIDCNQTVASELSEDIEFFFDISSLFEYYSMFNTKALAKYLGISDSKMRQYRSGAVAISDSELENIEARIHRLGLEMTTLRLV